jgi:t-SNARE complex subunit (syntaxin)
MERVTHAWGGADEAHRSVRSTVLQRSRHHRTLCIGVLYAITIVLVLAVVSKLY